jgi:hypothetical protein
MRRGALAAIGLAMFLLAGSGAATDRTTERRYKLFDRGILVLRAPADWQDEFRAAPDPQPPTIEFRPQTGKPFRVYVTPIWRNRPDIPLPAREWLRERVARGAEKARERALEKSVEVIAFQGRSGPGFYFSATDKAPPPGEFPHLTQGMLQVTQLLVTFTILTHAGETLVVRDALAMLRSASHLPPR